MTAAQYFWLVDHNDWSRWFAISTSPRICSSSLCFIGGIAKRKTANLRHLILLSRVTYWAPLEMLLVLMPRTPYFKVKWSSILLSIANSTFFFSFPSVSKLPSNLKIRCATKSFNPHCHTPPPPIPCSYNIQSHTAQLQHCENNLTQSERLICLCSHAYLIPIRIVFPLSKSFIHYIVSHIQWSETYPRPCVRYAHRFLIPYSRQFQGASHCGSCGNSDILRMLLRAQKSMTTCSSPQSYSNSMWHWPPPTLEQERFSHQQ